MIAVAYGGGLNSAAMLVGLRNSGIIPDLILFADTGGEKPETISHISKMNEWISGMSGWPKIISAQTVNREQTPITLEGRCLENEMLPSIAYGFKSCSEKHKRRPQDKFMNNWEPAKKWWKSGHLVTKAIGYDAGEERRVRPDDEKYHYWYPLIEWGWGRDDCEKAILDAGLDVPMKSACFFCPSSKKKEIDWLREHHPDLLQRALHMEDVAAKNLTSVKGLGRSFSWREYVKASESEKRLLPECSIESPCGCFDEAE